MEVSEIKKEVHLTYDKLVEYLLDKYGPAEYDYFCTDKCISKNPKVSRSKEGLCCHHIDEDKAMMLSNPKFASLRPFEYQKASRLVYCNILEHLILHVKIAEESFGENDGQLELPGIGGIFVICRQMNDYYGGYKYKNKDKKILFDIISNNFEQYAAILLYLTLLAHERPEYSTVFTKERLSCGWNGRVVERVYKMLQ